MSGSATFTIVMSSSSMNIAMQTATERPPAVGVGCILRGSSRGASAMSAERYGPRDLLPG